MNMALFKIHLKQNYLTMFNLNSVTIIIDENVKYQILQSYMQQKYFFSFHIHEEYYWLWLKAQFFLNNQISLIFR